MMNIAFFTQCQCCPTKGGTERTTALVAESMKKFHGFRCFSIFSISSGPDEREADVFEESIQVDYSEKSDPILAGFISANAISMVINQGDFYFCEAMHRTVRSHNLDCRQIFALHFMPGSGEEALISPGETWRLWRRRPFSKELLKIALYPFYHSFASKRFRCNYRNAEIFSDKVVLLSESFKEVWNMYAHGSKNRADDSLFSAIPNALSFDHFADSEEIKKKEKRILIVSRLDERQKRISKALRIWQSVSSLPGMEDWRLDIVGDGPDRNFYSNFVRKNNIERVSFHGRQDPRSFYSRSALFMMTSDYEGFGMTLIEASQYGVVPFAFDTYPALSDIITDSENGMIIPPDDMKSYAAQLTKLALDNDLRSSMALKAVENSRRYDRSIITDLWLNIIIEVSDGQS